MIASIFHDGIFNIAFLMLVQSMVEPISNNLSAKFIFVFIVLSAQICLTIRAWIIFIFFNIYFGSFFISFNFSCKSPLVILLKPFNIPLNLSNLKNFRKTSNTFRIFFLMPLYLPQMEFSPLRSLHHRCLLSKPYSTSQSALNRKGQLNVG